MADMNKNAVNKEQIRVLVSNIYDFQKMRISIGNRLVQSFYLSLGINPSTSPKDANKDEQSMIKNLRDEYTRISDGIASNNKTIKATIKDLNKKDETKVKFIRDENDYKLIDSYMFLLKAEQESVKVLEKYVKEHPMWDRFFSKVKGCGPLMSGVCIAYLDPYKARHVSSFFKYAGLDTVQDTDEDGNKIFLTLDENRRKVIQLFNDDGTSVYRDCETGEPYEGETVVCCHGRRKGDTEMQTYYIPSEDPGEKKLAVDEKTGEPLLKKGITYNPKLKTKLMGVLTGCLLKAKDPVYSKIYYDQRQRYDNSAYYKNMTDGHKNMMAQRYMIKEFLRAMWISWRQLEGLEVDEPYEVAKLGNKPHKYNEAQCLAARGEAV